MPESTDMLQQLFSLQGKTALVTGASGGIGRELAIGLAGAGATVGLHGRSVEQLDETKKLVEKIGGRAVSLPAELADAGQCRKLIGDAHSSLGRLDILTNCAGMNRRKPIDDVTEDDFETILKVNLASIVYLCQAAHSIMKSQGGGKIVNIGSITSSIGLGNISVYGMSKAALAQFTQTLAVEWAKDNIQVNCLCPGFIRTPLTEKPIWGDPHKATWLTQRIPMRRAGQAEELVGACLLFASPASSYLTGQMLTVDGGFLAGGSWEAE